MNKHAGMSGFQTRETCFVLLAAVAALRTPSPVEPLYSDGVSF